VGEGGSERVRPASPEGSDLVLTPPSLEKRGKSCHSEEPKATKNLVVR